MDFIKLSKLLDLQLNNLFACFDFIKIMNT